MRNIRRALREARRILDEERVRKAPVQIYRVAKKYAEVIEMEMDDDISGMLIPPASKRPRSKWTIVVNQSHSTVRKRFTVAHELGHLRLHGFTGPHADRGFKVRFRDQRTSDGSIAEEIEANQFAAEILMPTALLLERLADLEVEYAPGIQEDGSLADLAAEFRVSQQALSIRLSNLLV